MDEIKHTLDMIDGKLDIVEKCKVENSDKTYLKHGGQQKPAEKADTCTTTHPSLNDEKNVI